jgi:hypothetical protein
VAVSSLNMYSKKIDGFAGSLKSDARIRQHHNAENDEDDCNNGFVHKVFNLRSPLAFATGNEIKQHHDDRDDQQDMDDSAHRVAGDQTKEPENDEDDCDGV